MVFEALTGLFGGLGLFLIGMGRMSEGLQTFAAQGTRAMISRLTDNRLLGVLMGIGLTLLMQSSGAVSLLLVGLVNASLINLDQALGMLLGAGVGSTLTVQLFAFDHLSLAWWLVAAGAALSFCWQPRYRQIGQVSLGLGLIFLSLDRMTSIALPLKESPGFLEFMVWLTDRPVLTVLISAALASAIHSAATIALAMSLVESGVLPISAAFFVIYGANIGTTLTAVVSCLGSRQEAKQVAVANMLFKVAGVLLVSPFTGRFVSIMTSLSSDPSRLLANSHTAFNIVVLLAFTPFCTQFAEVIRRLIPGDDEVDVCPKFLDTQFLDTPELALHQAKKAIQHMSHIIKADMLPHVMTVLRYGTPKVRAHLEQKENTIDDSYRAVVKYLAGLSEHSLTSRQSEKQVLLLYVCSYLEHIGDIVSSLTDISWKIQEKNLELSDAGWREIEDMLNRVEERFGQALKAFENGNSEQAVEVIVHHPDVLRAEKDLRYSHFYRIANENPRGIDASAAHLDITDNLLRIDTYTVSIAQSVIGII